ncbi:MAG: CapA family protein [Lachnospiraceae bacterium]|nr:CapA family protein [Lachnospiraceae bacterium]
MNLPGALCTAALLAVTLLGSAGNAIPVTQVAEAGSSSPADGVTIVMVGDMLMHMPVLRAGQEADGSYCFDGLFAHVQPQIRSADIAIVNQETIMGGEELGGYTGYPTFNSPYAVGDAEANAGFDVVLQATNHALDRSAKGIENCLSFWETVYPQIAVTGIHESAEDQAEMTILTSGGIRIAVLNYTYGTNGIQMPRGKGYLVDYLSMDRVRADLERAEREADFTIVCPHWGIEYSLTPSGDQRQWAAFFAQEGADLIIGTHPHVIEPLEYLTEGDRQIPVYYSLGNFVNSTAGRGAGVMNRMVGGMARVNIGRAADGSAVVRKAEVIPLVTHLGEGEVTTYFLADYTQELAENNRIRLQDSTFSLENSRKLTDKVWAGGYSDR